MSEFQLSHIALVGARLSAFNDFGITSRNELKTRRIAPHSDATGINHSQRREEFAAQLPVWVHNIITDPDFPKRKKLLMPLRRFEGELKDKKDDEVVSAVMSAGFKDETFDPLDLPKTMPMQQRCSIVAHIGIWQEAYERLEEELVEIMASEDSAVSQWCELARRPGHTIVE
ncbi:MAG: hypothetical protein V7754_01800 [Halioglobus sp.]